MTMDAEDRIAEALEVAFEFGGEDGAHHKMWVIDQMVRALTGEDYSTWVATYEYVGDEQEYEWEQGIAP